MLFLIDSKLFRVKSPLLSRAAGLALRSSLARTDLAASVIQASKQDSIPTEVN